MQVETTMAKATKIRINFTGPLIRMESPFRIFPDAAFSCHYNILPGEHGKTPRGNVPIIIYELLFKTKKYSLSVSSIFFR
jgi:hypothetical protein